MYDTIIIGNGPAGISAAIYLKRFNFNPLVIGKDLGSLGYTSYIDNYYGFDHIKGTDLILKGIEQAKNLGIDVVNDEVIAIEYGTNCYIVKTKGNTYEGTSVFLATGKARNKLNVKNLQAFEGKGVSYCAICDGFFYRNKRLGIVGSGDFMKNELDTLKKFTKDIIIFTNGETTDQEGFTVVNDKIVSLYGEDDLSGVETEHGKYDLDGLFIAYGTANAVSFAKHLGLVLDSQNNIVVKDFQTNIPGIFAGGDVIGGLLQVSKAVGDGANASIEIKKYIQSKKAA
jgi:thioredoxin reductase (NADPH)